LDDEKLGVPGNAGLKDQNMALKWVKNNIKFFGGDQITLFGQSAGATSTHFHCVSDHSVGLFNRVILMSGCGFHDWAISPRRNWAFRLAKNLGYNGDENETEILDFLQNADPEKLTHAQESVLDLQEKKSYILFPFAPVIDGDFLKLNQAESQAAMYRKAWSNDIDVMIGGTSEEGLIQMSFVKDNPLVLKALDLEDLIPLDVKLAERNGDKARDLAVKIKNFYFKNSDHKTDETNYYQVKLKLAEKSVNQLIIKISGGWR
jgi:carboxylesterase type B